MLTVNKVKGFFLWHYTCIASTNLILTGSNDNDLLLSVKFVNITSSLTLPVLQYLDTHTYTK